MARKKTPSNQGAVWTAKDFAVIKRMVKSGAKGKEIAQAIGRSVVALYQKASVEGISLSAPRSAAKKSATKARKGTRRR